jgi:hypothetical protein
MTKLPEPKKYYGVDAEPDFSYFTEGQMHAHAADVSAALRSALKTAEAALADIGDATREPGDDLAWCERRAAQALPAVRAALKGMK